MKHGSLIFFILLLAGPVRALSPAELKSVTFQQKPGAALPLELEFVDEEGQPRELGDFFHTRPVILVLGYYECPMLCTLVSRGLINSLQDLKLDVGSDFDVLHVSIDPGEGPELAARKKANYLRSYGRKGAEQGWHFLTGNADAIQALADAVGFQYRYDLEIDQYAHPSGIVILTPEGRVSGYMFGVDFPAKKLRLALVQAGEGETGSPVDQLLLLCYHYIPLTGKYGTAILWTVRLLGAATVIALIGAVFRMMRRERKEPQ